MSSQITWIFHAYESPGGGAGQGVRGCGAGVRGAGGQDCRRGDVTHHRHHLSSSELGIDGVHIFALNSRK